MANGSDLLLLCRDSRRSGAGQPQTGRRRSPTTREWKGGPTGPRVPPSTQRRRVGPRNRALLWEPVAVVQRPPVDCELVKKTPGTLQDGEPEYFIEPTGFHGESLGGYCRPYLSFSNCIMSVPTMDVLL